MSSLEGNMPGPMALSLLALIIFLIVGFSKMFFVILSLQEEHTCMLVRRLIIIIIISLKARSGKLSQSGLSSISAMLASIGFSKMRMSSALQHRQLPILIAVHSLKGNVVFV